jgi:hypothetical protein
MNGGGDVQGRSDKESMKNQWDCDMGMFRRCFGMIYMNMFDYLSYMPRVAHMISNKITESVAIETFCTFGSNYTRLQRFNISRK